MRLPSWATDLPEEEERTRRIVFQRLLAGEAISLRGEGLLPGTLIEEGRIVLDDAGEWVVAAAGLSTVPTKHEMWIAGRRFYASCAFDTVGIPAALEAPAQVRSACGFCNEVIELELPTALSRTDLRVWLCEEQVGSSFVADT